MAELELLHPNLIRLTSSRRSGRTPGVDAQLAFWGCPDHGINFKRDLCAGCNAAYMRKYLRDRRLSDPQWDIFYRAQKRATKQRLVFTIVAEDVTLPLNCPVLGIRLIVGGRRSAASPSLDRINPNLGYIPGNVRVISDRANCLKGSADLSRLRYLANHGRFDIRAEYAAVARYLERELLLVEVRNRANGGGSCGVEWLKIAAFLERAFRNGASESR